jgi:hypothetical protein
MHSYDINSHPSPEHRSTVWISSILRPGLDVMIHRKRPAINFVWIDMPISPIGCLLAHLADKPMQ